MFTEARSRGPRRLTLQTSPYVQDQSLIATISLASGMGRLALGSDLHAVYKHVRWLMFTWRLHRDGRALETAVESL